MRGSRDGSHSYSSTDSFRVLLWWPALSVIWWAAIPGAGPGDVLGIGLGLAILALVDAGASVWGRRHRANRAGSDYEVLPAQAAAGAPSATDPALEPRDVSRSDLIGA